MRKLSPHHLHHEPHVKRRRGGEGSDGSDDEYPIGVRYERQRQKEGVHNIQADKTKKEKGGGEGLWNGKWEELTTTRNSTGIRYEGGRKQKLQVHDNVRM